MTTYRHRQHRGGSGFATKRRLRKMLMADLPRGAVYAPYIGDGDLAVECYADWDIFGADIDAECVAVARERLPRATVILADCERMFPFSSPSTLPLFALCDADAWGRPYDAIARFLESARLCDEIVIVGTSGEFVGVGQRQHKRGGLILPNGQRLLGTQNWNRLRMTYVRREIAPWLSELLRGRGFSLVSHNKRTYGAMIYWGVRAVRDD